MDRLDHAIDVREHFVVPEPKHTIAAALEVPGPGCIGGDALGCSVLYPVEFDDEPMLQATEIRKEGTERHLSAKVGSVERELSAEVPPELPLGVRRIAAERTGTITAVV